MIEVEELREDEIRGLLSRLHYGHLAVADDDVPYVVPVHFAYDNGEIIVYTTDGKKSVIINKNPLVCLQAEEVIDNEHWESVIVNGKAIRLTEDIEIANALKLITSINPTLTPAISVHWLDNWVKENIPVIYHIAPERSSGLRAASRTDAR